jgi:branched-chain amino acid transport system permease protein
VTATAAALAGAAHDARRAWDVRATVGAAVVAVASAAPLVVSAPRLEDLATGLYLALAATGLALAVGVAGMPSLAQGAFMAVGAFTAAQLRIHGGVPTVAAALVGAVAAAGAGVLTGVGFVRLNRGLVAVSTWILAWLVALGLEAFPSVSGGAQGLVLPEGPSTTVHYELALALVALTALGLVALARGPFGLRLAAARDGRAAAAALGVPVPRLRLTAFVASAAVGGLAGGLSVQLAGIADAASYGPYLSFKIFVAVLIGGAASAAGPFLGVVVLGLVSLAADAVGAVENVSSARFHPLLASVLLLAVLSLGGEGLLRAPRRRRFAAAVPSEPRDTVSQGRLDGRRLTKRYGDLVALEGLDIDVPAGEIVALIGPNGSGKTTALRLLAGTERADAGTVESAGRIARTLQATATFGELTAVEHLLVASAGARRHGGLARTLLATPKARAEEAAATARAREILARFGLSDGADTPASELSGADQRLLMIAAAYATGAAVLLLDEPSAGAAHGEVDRLARVLTGLRDEGLAILVVEHNLRLVRTVAARIVALDAGRAIARGTPEQVGADPAVRGAYLGSHTL